MRWNRLRRIVMVVVLVVVVIAAAIWLKAFINDKLGSVICEYAPSESGSGP